VRVLARWPKGADLSGRTAVVAARLALLVLLTLLVAVGLHGRVTSPAWGSRSKAHDAEVVAALLAVGVVLLVVLAVRSRRAPPGALLAARLRTALWYLLGTGVPVLVVTLVFLLVNLRLGPLRAAGAPARSPVGRRGPATLLPKASATSSHFPLAAILYALAAAVLVAAIVVVSVWIVRHSRRQPQAEPDVPAQEYGEALQEALVWGQRALLDLDDARAAIIACYVAMEESLARAGTVRTSAETPDELLAKAASTLLIGAGAARRLTSLFYEARFSTHPLADKQKTAAASALAEISSELGRAQPAPVGTEP
jgi:hypothetical protein